MKQIEKDLLNMVQHDFPLVRRPFAIIAGQLGISEQECIDLLVALNNEGVLREIRPVIDWKKAGFISVLIGLKVEPEQVDEVACAISAIPGVTHNYLREGWLNLWCTLTYDNVEEKKRHLAFMRSQNGVEDLKEFASEKIYKIGLVLDV